MRARRPAADLPPGGRVLDRRRLEVIDLLAAETGCGRHFAEVQVDFSLVAAAPGGRARRTRRPGSILPSDLPGTRALAVRRPVGVVAAIAPWNAALVLAGRAIVGPLALGNTVVLKPSEESPITGGTLWAEIFAEAGLPPGALNVVTHALRRRRRDRRGTGHPSARTADQLHRLDGHRAAAGRAGRPPPQAAGAAAVSGHNSLIVLADADLRPRRGRGRVRRVRAPGRGVHVRAPHPRRTADRRPSSRARFIAKVATLPVGDPRRPGHGDRPADQPVGAVAGQPAGRGGGRDGRAAADRREAQPPCYPPTVLTDVPAEAEIAFEETFGPVVAAGDGRRTRDEAVRAGQRHPVRADRRHPHRRHVPGARPGPPARGRHRAHQRPAGQRRAADALRRRSRTAAGAASGSASPPRTSPSCSGSRCATPPASSRSDCVHAPVIHGSGSTGRPPSRTSKCRCGPVAAPVEPTRPISCPALTG